MLLSELGPNYIENILFFVGISKFLPRFNVLKFFMIFSRALLLNYSLMSKA